jgi:hypothetical protein
MDNETKQQITSIVEADVRSLKDGTKFCFKDFLAKYNLSNEEMTELSTDLASKLNAYIASTVDGQTVGLPQNITYVRICLADFFKKLPFEFYLSDALRRLSFKLSPNLFAVITKSQIIKIDDQTKTNKLWQDFLTFAKTTKQYRPIVIKNNSKIDGAYIEEYWKRSLKNIFKKVPDTELTINYLTKVFKENGYDIIEK